MALKPVSLLSRTTCPHCWESFGPAEVLWIATHPDLVGDPQLGPEQFHRFLPSRFDGDGNAIDARGMVARFLACPKCHLPIPRALLETEPFFMSMFGVPACGKSYFLAAMIYEARRLLPDCFGLSLTDADTVANRSFNEYEEQMFVNQHAGELTPLSDLIRKTELQGELYDTVTYGARSVTYPRPFLFLLQARENHECFAQADRVARVLCLYDNAGEHFLPGQDSPNNPVTQHLSLSRVLLFLFDLTQHQRFRALGDDSGSQLSHLAQTRTSRQELILVETAARVRRQLGLSHREKYRQPLVIVLTKADTWGDHVKIAPVPEPWMTRNGRTGLNVELIEHQSLQLRSMLMAFCPELVVAADDFAEKVLYVAVSALGQSPEPDPDSRSPAIRPRDIRPSGVVTPLLYGLYQRARGTIAVIKRKQGSDPLLRLPANPGARSVSSDSTPARESPQ
jgi:hypothetical protein